MEGRKLKLFTAPCLIHLLVILKFVMAEMESDIMNCPADCQCFPVEENEIYDPPTYSRVREIENGTVIAASCLRQQLTQVPVGFAQSTAVLFLSYNDLTHLNRSMFTGLNKLKMLDVSHNKLVSIDNDTFDEMRELEQLDLSFNKIKWLPEGFLCPWYRRGFAAEQSDSTGCSGWITATTQLQLVLGQNPWHCNCLLQQFVEHFSCAYEKAPCIDFAIEKDDPIGHCVSPPNMRGVALTRLSSFETRKGHINVCKFRQVYIDVPLLVTMFTWIGAVLGYVAYFISWNNKDIANHRSYLSTLNFHQQVSNFGSRKTKSPTRSSNSTLNRQIRRPNGRHVQRQESKEIQKELPTVEITEVNSPEIWIERPECGFGLQSDTCLLQPNAHILEVQSVDTPEKEGSRSGSTGNIQEENKNIDIHRLSSL